MAGRSGYNCCANAFVLAADVVVNSTSSTPNEGLKASSFIAGFEIFASSDVSHSISFSIPKKSDPLFLTYISLI